MRILPLCVLATLAACDGDSSLSAVDQAATPIQANQTLVVPILRPGQYAQVVYTGPALISQVYLAGSVVGTGPGPCPASLNGACIDLDAPFVAGATTTDPSGVARFSIQVPWNAPVGAIPCFQGIEVVPGNIARTSLPVCTVVQPCVPVAVSISLVDIGTFQTPAYNVVGLTVTGSGNVHAAGPQGLGIVGGAADDTVDSAEQITFTFNTGVVQNVSYLVPYASNGDGDSLDGERIVEAFDDHGVSYGQVSHNGVGSFLVQSGPVSSFTITADADAFRVGAVNYIGCQ